MGRGEAGDPAGMGAFPLEHAPRKGGKRVILHGFPGFPQGKLGFSEGIGTISAPCAEIHGVHAGFPTGQDSFPAIFDN